MLLTNLAATVGRSNGETVERARVVDKEKKKITSGLRSKLEMLRDEDDRQKQSGFAGMTQHERGVIDRKLEN